MGSRACHPKNDTKEVATADGLIENSNAPAPRHLPRPNRIRALHVCRVHGNTKGVVANPDHQRTYNSRCADLLQTPTIKEHITVGLRICITARVLENPRFDAKPTGAA